MYTQVNLNISEWINGFFFFFLQQFRQNSPIRDTSVAIRIRLNSTKEPHSSAQVEFFQNKITTSRLIFAMSI